MLRIASSVVVAAVSVMLCAAQAAAANPPNPPPGTVAAQPMSVGAGSSSQPVVQRMTYSTRSKTIKKKVEPRH